MTHEFADMKIYACIVFKFETFGNLFLIKQQTKTS